MRVEIRQRPSFALARLVLGPDEGCRVEPGALHSMSDGVEMTSRSGGGTIKSLRRALAGEPLFLATCTAPPRGGWVDVAPHLPGDVQVLDLDGEPGWCINRGRWLASSGGVELDGRWTGLTSLLNGEGFLSHATGHGQVVVTCYGALEAVTLAPDETVSINTGHVVAYRDNVKCSTREVARGLVDSVKTGSNMVCDFVGPGRVLTQTRNPAALAAWARAKNPVS